MTLSSLLFFLMGSTAVHGQLVSSLAEEFFRQTITDQELDAYLEAAFQIQHKQQETQKRLWSIATRHKLSAAEYQTLYARTELSVHGDSTCSNPDDPTELAFCRSSSQMDRVETELIGQIIGIIESIGLTVQRFAEIRNELDDPDLQKRMRKILRKRTRSGAGAVVNRNEPSPKTFRQGGEPETRDAKSGNANKTPRLPMEPFLTNHSDRDAENLSIERLILHQLLHSEPLAEILDQRALVRSLFPLEDFRLRSFQFIAQQLELRTPLTIHLGEEKIRNQIEENRHMRNERAKAPDFLNHLRVVSTESTGHSGGEELSHDHTADPQSGEPILAERSEPRDPQSESEIQMDNMLIDEIYTPFGRDFFEQFYTQWEFPEGTGGFVVRIIERMMPGRGSQMMIEVNHEVVWQFRLQPIYEMIAELAEIVADELADYLQNFDNYADTYF